MGPILNLILFPVHLVMFLMDVAILFLLVRILNNIFTARPLAFLDRVGGTGVDIVTGAISHHTRNWWKQTLSSRQEEAVALFLISIARWALGCILAGFA